MQRLVELVKKPEQKPVGNVRVQDVPPQMKQHVPGSYVDKFDDNGDGGPEQPVPDHGLN